MPRKKAIVKDIRLEKFLELQPSYRLDCTLTDAVITRERLRSSVWYNIWRTTFWSYLEDYVVQTKAQVLGETSDEITIVKHRGTGAGITLKNGIYVVYPKKDRREGIMLDLPIGVDIHDPEEDGDGYFERTYHLKVPERIITSGNKRSIKAWLVAQMRKVQAKQRKDHIDTLRKLKAENPSLFKEVAKEKE